jgi:hypothetical protein
VIKDGGAKWNGSYIKKLRCRCPRCGKHFLVFYNPSPRLREPELFDITEIINGGFIEIPNLIEGEPPYRMDADRYFDNGYDSDDFNREGEYIDGGRFDEQGYDYLALTETGMIGEGMIKEA